MEVRPAMLRPPDAAVSALSFFSVDAVLPLQPPPLPGQRTPLGQILVGGFRSRRAGCGGCEIVQRRLLSCVRVAAGVLLDGGHPQSLGAVRDGDGAHAVGRGIAAGPWRGLGLGRRGGPEGVRGPAGGGGRSRRRMRLDDANEC